MNIQVKMENEGAKKMTCEDALRRLEEARRLKREYVKVGSINSIFYFLHKAAEPFNCLEQDNLA